MTDTMNQMFPGDGLELPNKQERDRADALIAEWAARWGEEAVTIARVHPDVTIEGYANYLAGTPTNRAYLRSQLRRWFGRPGS